MSRFFIQEYGHPRTIAHCQVSPQEVSIIHDYQDQISEPEAESEVKSMCDDILHTVSIPAYETHCWKEDSSPNLDGRAKQNLTAWPQPHVANVLFAESVRGPFRVTVPVLILQPGKTTETLIGTAQRVTLILITIWHRDFWVVSPVVGIV